LSEPELGRLLRKAQADERMPSVAAAVFRGGELVWQDAVGLADVAGTRATTDTQYRLGSITKTFTAAAVLQLRDEGRLDLDDAIGDHVDGLGKPTLRRLLSHMSGMQREPPGEVWQTLEMPSREELLGRLGEIEQVLAPSTAWHYSNIAYVLLGEVVERLDGRPYREAIEARLLRPLGLERTTWEQAEPWARGYLVDPYSDSVHEESPLDTRSFTAAGQLWSGVGDVASWGRFLADPDEAVLRRDSRDEMLTVHAMDEAERWTRGWGLGLALVRRGDRIWAGHGGAMPGHLAALVFRPQERVGAVALTNSSARANPDVLALDLAEAALEAEPPEWAPAEPPPRELAGALGRWWSEGEEFLFRWHEGRLEARLGRAPEFRPWAVFEQVDGDEYRTVAGRERGERLRLIRDDAGEIVKLSWAGYAFTRTPELFA
jgi:CubicO group peptidase (beta-lactamase class C family)